MRYVTTRHRLGETFEPPAEGWVFHAATTAVECPCPPHAKFQINMATIWLVVVWRWRAPSKHRPKPPPTKLPADPRTLS